MNPSAYGLEREPYQAYFSMIPPFLALLYPVIKSTLCSQGLICSEILHIWNMEELCSRCLVPALSVAQ